MLDLDVITNTIVELENSDTNFSNCQKLASLYTVMEHFNHQTDAVQKELTDILPQYQTYRQAKRKYKLGELSESAVLSAMHATCIEISEFIQMLYTSTDTQEERKEIKQLVHDLNERY